MAHVLLDTMFCNQNASNNTLGTEPSPDKSITFVIKIESANYNTIGKNKTKGSPGNISNYLNLFPLVVQRLFKFMNLLMKLFFLRFHPIMKALIEVIEADTRLVHWSVPRL